MKNFFVKTAALLFSLTMIGSIVPASAIAERDSRHFLIENEGSSQNTEMRSDASADTEIGAVSSQAVLGRGFDISEQTAAGHTEAKPALSSTPSAESNPIKSGYYTYTLDSNRRATIVRGDAALSGSITIPFSIDGYPVVAIGYRAFADCTLITGLSFPRNSSVKRIESGAFTGCTALAQISIPDGVTGIGRGAFDRTAWYDCQNDGLVYLGKVLYDNKNADYVRSDIAEGTVAIADYAFSDCTRLGGMTIPDSVVAIGEGAFRNCTDLHWITIGSGLTSIGKDAFENCTVLSEVIHRGSVKKWSQISFGSLYANPLCYAHGLFYADPQVANRYVAVSRFSVPDDVTKIQDYAFAGCTIQSVTGGRNLKEIGDYAFYDCEYLEKIELPASVTDIGKFAFYKTALTDAVIPDGIQRIGYGAFSCCDKLKYNAYDQALYLGSSGNHPYFVLVKAQSQSILSCEIHPDAKFILDDAFLKCRNLNHIDIPAGIMSVGKGAFTGCSSLERITVSPENPYYCSVSGVLFDHDRTELIHSPDRLKWQLTIMYVDWLGNSLTEPKRMLISPNAKYSSIPPVIEHYSADRETVSGVMLNGDETVTVTYYEKTIRLSGNCGSDISFKLYEDGDLILKGSGAMPDYREAGAPWYADADRIRRIVIDSRITAIGDNAFSDCCHAASVELGYGIRSIGEGAFSGCEILQYLSLPDSVQRLSEKAFFGCTGLSEISIPKNVTDVAAYAFYGCTALGAVTFGNALQTVGDGAFAGCDRLSTVTFCGKPLVGCGTDMFGQTDGDVVLYYYGNIPGWDTALSDGMTYCGYRAFPMNAIRKQENIGSDSLCYLKIVDRFNHPLAGAKVTVHGSTYTANQYGLVYLEKPDGSVPLTVTCDDHHPFSDPAYRLSAQMMDVITLSDKPSAVQGVSCDGNSIAGSLYTLNCSRTDSVSIRVSGYSKYTILRYELIQENRLVAAVHTSASSAEFSVRANSFCEGKNVMVKMYASDGSTAAEVLNLDIVNIAPIDKALLLDEISALNLLVDFGDFGKVNLPLNFRRDGNAAIYSYVNGRTIRVGINTDVGAIAKELTGQSDGSIKRYIEKKVDESLKSKADRKGTGFQYKICGYIDIEYLGNGQYYVKTSYVKVAVSAKVAFNAEVSYLGLVGVYFKASLSADTSLNLQVTKYVPEAGFGVDSLTLSIEDRLELQAGIYIIFRFGTASVYGNVAMGFDLQLIPDAAFQRVYVKGEIGAKWSLLWGLVSGSHKFCEGTVYEWNAAQKSMAKALYSVMLSDAYGDADNYRIQDRAYLAERSFWLPCREALLMTESGGEYFDLQTNTYGNIAPKIVSTGEYTVMVWLDDNADRDTFNFQTLYYSVYDRDQNTWSEPKQVDNNGTFDCQFDVIADGDDIYLAYTEQKEAAGERQDLDIADADAVADYVSGVELAFSQFREGEFSPPLSVTDNDVCEILPTLSVTDGVLSVNFIVSDNLGITDNGHKDSLYRAEYRDGSFTVPHAVSEGQNIITAAASGSLNGENVTVCIVDADGDSLTKDDLSLVLFDDQNRAAVIDTGLIGDISFALVGQRQMLLWIHDGAVYCLGDKADQCVNLFEHLDISAYRYRVLTKDAQTYLTFVSDAVDGDTASTDVFAVAIDGTGAVSSPVRLTKTDGFIESFDGVSVTDGILIAFNETKSEFSGDEVTTKSDFRYCLYSCGVDLDVISVDYDVDAVQPGKQVDFDMDIRNNGLSSTAHLAATLFRGGEDISLDEVFATVAPGETETVRFTLTMPEEFSGEYRIEVMPADAREKDCADNGAEIVLSYGDLSLDAEQIMVNGKSRLLIAIANNGNVPAGGVLSVSSGDPGDTPIDTVTVDPIEPGAAILLSTETDELGLTENLIHLRIESCRDRYVTDNAVSLRLFGIDDDSYAEAENVPTENPTLACSYVRFDRYTDYDLKVEISCGSEHFDGIQGLSAGKDYTVAADEVTLSHDYLMALTDDTTLQFLFAYNSFNTVCRQLTIRAADTTPRTIGGSVQILGSITVGSTVSAGVAGIMPTEASLSYEWWINHVLVGQESSFVVPFDTAEQELTLIVKGRDGYQGEIRQAYTIAKAVKNAPRTPIILTVSDSAVSIASVSGVEYSLNGEKWQDNGNFSGLLPGAAYSIGARYRETENTGISDAVWISVTTPKAHIPAPERPQAVSVEDTYIELVPIDGYEYCCNDGEWQTSSLFEHLIPGTDYVFRQRAAETDRSYESPSSEELCLTTKQYRFTWHLSAAGFGNSADGIQICLKAENGMILRRWTAYGQEDLSLLLDRGTYLLTVEKKNHVPVTKIISGKDEPIDTAIQLYLYGDANADGAIDGRDVVRLNNYLADIDKNEGTSAFAITPGADTDANGVIDRQDLVRLKQYFALFDYETGTSTVVIGPEEFWFEEGFVYEKN